ncbi:MAG: 1-deoxy-D-xylulose-5-phosphate synthase [Candidatus Woesearchaeota archaeon]|nr:1-deoxy-D-xylulose-5-phosphate synthase [Candidatus Woesearchaeota archaeon]
MDKTNFLDIINEPKDLRLLNKVQLKYLANELRQYIINTVSKTGGHLAPSLGVVELTIALHYVFNSPTDRIVWDVGHQSYPHKLLTGRKDIFSTLRQYKGMSGFPKTEESDHDAFNTGHSSTSISAALGIAKARDLKEEDHKVIAVIGDGAMTGGLAFEGLNHAGSSKTNLIVILNDNKMSISPNVGALSSYLGKMVTNPKYHEIRKKLEHSLRRVPRIGSKAAEKAMNLEDTLRALSNPGMLFKELGFSYFGPIDGHNLDDLIKALHNIKLIEGPILLHIHTKKGKGYSHAENNKTKFHGISPFNIDDGEKVKCANAPTYTEIFSKTIVKLAQENEKITAITAAMAPGTGLDDFSKQFPERFFDVGIAEQHAVTFAAGLAINGFKPICAIYSTFLQRAFDQIIHDVCLQKLPVIFAIDRAGLVGEDGPTHHGPFDISFLRHIPNLVIMAPKDENEFQHMLKTAEQHNGPVAIRYPRACGLGIELDEKLTSLPMGKAEIIEEGKDVLILAIGTCVQKSIEAAEELEKNNIKPTIVNARFAKPLDEQLIIKLANKIPNILTVEENTLEGGFGSSILEILEKNNIKANVERIGVPDKFVEAGPIDVLKKSIGLTKENIAKVATKLVKK